MKEFKQKTDRSAIPISFCPNLFTLCTLQAFATQDSTPRFFRYFATFAVLVLQHAYLAK